MAAEQLTDKENQFKKRARRRLVGAVALVLLMITVLPLVLDDRSGQKSSQPEIAISIPSQDGDFNSKIIPVTAPAADAPKPGQMASPLDKPEASKSAEAPVTPEPKSAPVAEVKAKQEEAKPVAKAAETAPQAIPDAPKKTEDSKAAIKVAESQPTESKPIEAKPTQTETKPVVEPKPQAETKTADPKPAAAKTTAVKKGSVSVQIGVFSDAVKVKQLKAKIAEKSVQCYTENLQTANGVKIRLRCGPYPGKPEAQQALDRVKAAGYDGILVTNQ